MTWLYIRLPAEIGVVNLKCGDILKVVNSEDCPGYSKRPCVKAGPCCLGTSTTCKQNNCPNNQK